MITYLHKCTADIELKKINLKPGVDTPTYVKYFFFPHIQNQDSQTTTTSRWANIVLPAKLQTGHFFGLDQI